MRAASVGCVKKALYFKAISEFASVKREFKIEALEAVTFTRTEECIEILAMQLCQM